MLPVGVAQFVVRVRLCWCRWPWGHQETNNQPMERYIDQALSFHPAETLRTTGQPKTRKDIPNPKVRHVTTWRIAKKGSCLPRGTGSARRRMAPSVSWSVSRSLGGLMVGLMEMFSPLASKGGIWRMIRSGGSIV